MINKFYKNPFFICLFFLICFMSYYYFYHEKKSMSHAVRQEAKRLTKENLYTLPSAETLPSNYLDYSGKRN